MQRDADNIVCATCIGLPLKSDGTMVHKNYQAEIEQKEGDNMAFATDNVYLFVSPFARDNTGGGLLYVEQASLKCGTGWFFQEMSLSQPMIQTATTGKEVEKWNNVFESLKQMWLFSVSALILRR